MTILKSQYAKTLVILVVTVIYGVVSLLSQGKFTMTELWGLVYMAVGDLLVFLTKNWNYNSPRTVPPPMDASPHP